MFGESYKGRIFNQMLEGDTTLAPNLWKLQAVLSLQKAVVAFGLRILLAVDTLRSEGLWLLI